MKSEHVGTEEHDVLPDPDFLENAKAADLSARIPIPKRQTNIEKVREAEIEFLASQQVHQLLVLELARTRNVVELTHIAQSLKAVLVYRERGYQEREFK